MLPLRGVRGGSSGLLNLLTESRGTSWNPLESTLGWSSERPPMCLSRYSSACLSGLQASVPMGMVEPLLDGYWGMVTPS